MHTQQVIRESMRMFPVSASGLGRCTTEPTVIGGYLVPATTEVQVRSFCHFSSAQHLPVRYMNKKELLYLYS